MIYIEAQNAAVLARRDRNKPEIHFEILEVSAHNMAVNMTAGRLVRHLPDAAATISSKFLEDPKFSKTLYSTLVAMSKKQDNVSPSRGSSAANMPSSMDTTSPALLTDLLNGFLQGYGHAAQLNQIVKHSRDEVIMSGESKSAPWRRSPVWQLLKMATQILLCRESNNGLWLYKQFMLQFMARMLRLACNAHLPSDMLFMMKAKLAKRLNKLPHNPKFYGLQQISEAMRLCQQKIAERWQLAIQHYRKPEHFVAEELKQLEWDNHGTFPLPSAEFFCNIEPINQNNAQPVITKIYSSLWSINFDKVPVFPPVVSNAGDESIAILISNLAIFERWIQYELAGWCSTRIQSDDPDIRGDSINGVFETAERYFQIASPIYKSNPHAMSMMYLTLLEMVIVCDKLACKSLSQLSAFVIPLESRIWSTLLLGSNEQLQRLREAECYILKRSKNEEGQPKKNHGILYKLGEGDSFAVLSFSDNDSYALSKRRIMSDINGERDRKSIEFEKLKAKRTRLIEEAQKLPHEEISNSNSSDEPGQHDPLCRPCCLLQESRGLTIEPYQNPLPASEDLAKAVIFELQVPVAFQAWRDFMVFFNTEVLQFSVKSPGCVEFPQMLKDFDGLKHRFRPSTRKPTVTIAGNLKLLKPPKRVEITDQTTIEDVCLPQPPTWCYYNSRTKATLGSLHITDHVETSCAFQLPARSKKEQDLQTRKHSEPDGPSTNTVVARQLASPTHLTVNEFHSLYGMPLGSGITWRNMLIELTAQSIDLQKQETALALTQMVLQAGPTGTKRRTQEDLYDAPFVQSLTNRLTFVVTEVAENWEACRILAVCIVIATRIDDSHVDSKPEVEQLLSCCLNIATDQRRRAHDASVTEDACGTTVHETEVNSATADIAMDRMRKQMEIALACVYIFSSDEASDRRMTRLLGDVGFMQLFFECIITVRECREAVDTLDQFQKYLYFCLRRFVPRAGVAIVLSQSHVGEALNLSGSAKAGLTAAVQRSLPHLRNIGEWQFQHDHWFSGAAETEGDSTPRPVSFNMLTGELYFNGLAAMFAPVQYRNAPHFKELFGDKELSIACESSTELQVTKLFNGYTVKLGMNREQLRVVAHREFDDGETDYLLIPHRYLEEDMLPKSMRSKYLLWHHSQSGEIHFSHIDKPWDICGDEWMLFNVQDG